MQHRNVRWTLWILCWLVPSVAQAEENRKTAQDAPHASAKQPAGTSGYLALGAKLGLAEASFDYRVGPGLSEYQTGPAIGLIARIGYNERLALQPELVYIQRGAKVPHMDTILGSFSLSYIEAPLLAVVRLPIRMELAPYLLFGPTIGRTIHAERKDAVGVRDIEVNPWNMAATAGIGATWEATPYLGLDIELRYEHGLTRVFDDMGYNRSMVLSIGGTFSIRRDTDRDGIANRSDRCWKQAETYNGTEDTDGCPDSDRDGDRIVDARDSVCPDNAEDRDGFQDQDGCPDPDNDGDDILDVDEPAECRNRYFPRRQGSKSQNPGCFPAYQNVKIEYRITRDREGIERIERVTRLSLERPILFDKGIGVLTDSHRSILDEVAAMLQDHPAVLLRIHGHADSDGSASNNEALSKTRAAAVRHYLVTQAQIAPCRLVTQEQGESERLYDEDSEAGKAQNRRVWFEIINERKPGCVPEP